MDSSQMIFGLYGLGAAAGALAAAKAKSRLELSLAKHRSLAGHSRISRWVARLVPFYQFDETEYFCTDGAPAEVAAQRRAAFDRLADDYRSRFAKTIDLKSSVKAGISDLQFTDTYRVPFPYAHMVRERLGGSPFLDNSSGVVLTDVDGNRFYDVAGSYGVNLLGYEVYKGFIEDVIRQVGALGPVLGAYHPVVAYNVARLREISGLDEVSFHMSGTEAVMQAVRLARYHTGRSHLVRFCGAYHGWWGDVQPGAGNPEPPAATYTLADMSQAALKVLRRRRDIACVLVNPLQALHPNRPAPADSGLIDSSRSAGFDKDAYAGWLKQVRKVCTERGIVLILDEVFVGFRLAARGAQEYFGISADMVTYGKTLGGGLPVGVLCGRRELMRRYREDRPADICFARGTFNSHPYVMGTMRAFLKHMASPAGRALYKDIDATWMERARSINERLTERGLPVQVSALSTIWTILYEAPSRYNWMFQYYLRAHGLALSWVGTGRLIFSLNYQDADFADVSERFVAAAEAMKSDGWWWLAPQEAQVPRSIRRQMLHEMITLGYLRRPQRT
jgi:glutamate-1-semialdehyde 2,1-aminomutase